MNLEEFEKSKNELLKTKEQNNRQISICDEKARLSKVNLPENKKITTIAFSVLGYLPVFLATSSLIKKIGVTAFTNVIPALSYPAIVVGSSFGVGALIRFLMNKKYKTKERYKSFSTAKNEVEKLEEEIHYQIELEKANNKNKAIDETLKVMESNQAMLKMMSSRYDLNSKTAPQTKEEAELKTNDLSGIIKEQYEKLDVLTTQKVLHDKFWRIRSKSRKGMDIILVSVLTGTFMMYFAGLSLASVKDAITFNSIYAILATVFTPFIAGMVVAGGNMIKRNKNYKKVFNNLNSQLGENALEEVYKKFDGDYEEQQELERLIETQIRDISLAEVQLQESKRCLDTFMTEEDNQEKVSFKDYSPLQIAEETRQTALERRELYSSLSAEKRTENFYTEEYEQRREDAKGPTLVKKRTYTKHK